MDIHTKPKGSEECPLLELRAIKKDFVSGWGARRRAVHAVDDVSLSIHRGQSVGLVGESGSGKSTVARLIARLFPPTAGHMLLDGQDVLADGQRRAPREYRHQVQMIFQDPFSSLNPVHTVGHHLLRALRIHETLGARPPVAAVEELLEIVGLGGVPGIAGRFPHELSGGQRQRVAIARTLAVAPSLIVADEPTSMLDVSVRVGILNLLEELRHLRNIGLLLITHDLASARYSTDSTLVMYAGFILEAGPTDALIASPKHPYTQLLISCIPRRSQRRPVLSNIVRTPTENIATPDRRGCPFVARCPCRMALCEAVMPPPSPIGDDRWVRCHLYGVAPSSQEHVGDGGAQHTTQAGAVGEDAT
jgi:peptide/nickel transport system ATP-binding protein